MKFFAWDPQRRGLTFNYFPFSTTTKFLKEDIFMSFFKKVR